MTKLTLALISVVFLGFNFRHLTQSKQAEQPTKMEIMDRLEKEKIQILIDTYKTSLNSSDAALAQSVYTKDGVFVPQGRPSSTGSSDIFKSHEDIFNRVRYDIEFFIEEIVVEDNIAFATTSSKGTSTILASGESAIEENREIFIFEKLDDQWGIARYMFNNQE